MWGKVSPGGTCHYPSHLYLSGVRRGSDADAEGGDGYKRVAGRLSGGLTNGVRKPWDIIKTAQGNSFIVGELRRLAALLGLALLFLPGLFVFPAPAATGLSRGFPVSVDSPRMVIPTAGTFVGWRDDFTDSTHISSWTGIELSAGTARLQPGLLNRLGRVLSFGNPGDFDSNDAFAPNVLVDGGLYKMWYTGRTSYEASIGYATSPDATTWSKQGEVLVPSLPEEAGNIIAYPAVLKIGNDFRMWYSGWDGAHFRILAANSSDGVSWLKQGLVLDIGGPGSPDDSTVVDASVLLVNGTYLMWYTGRSDADYRGEIMLATSLDGTSWSRQGIVMTRGPPDSIDGYYAAFPGVRFDGSNFQALYTATDNAGTARLALAESADGVSWQKLGLALDVLPPDESPSMGFPDFLIQPNGTWDVYYHARGSALQIYHAVRLPITNRIGWLRSVPVTIPEGLEWGWLNWSGTIPLASSLTVSVVDGATAQPIPGFENASSESLDLRLLPPRAYQTIELEAWFHGTENESAALDSWQITWIDREAPAFSGLETAADMGTGGSVRLTWSSAHDPSSPIEYRIFQTTGTAPFDYSSPSHTAMNASFNVTGLANGIFYRFVVRAEDPWGNQDANTVSRGVVPTTPIDLTPPTFAGLDAAQDRGTGGQVLLSWNPAVDPDTPESNSDPALPIQYLTFVAKSGQGFDFGHPAAVTTNSSIIVTSLTDGIDYQFLVRALDANGNMESNDVVKYAVPTHGYDATPPTFGGVSAIVDLGTGNRVRITWEVAIDPDTPESNVDPSLPLKYSVFVSDDAAGLGSGTPEVVTEGRSAEVGGLTTGVRYYALVRAADHAGNGESNLRIVAFEVATPLLSYAWIPAAIVAGAVATVLAVRWVRRKKTPPPP